MNMRPSVAWGRSRYREEKNTLTTQLTPTDPIRSSKPSFYDHDEVFIHTLSFSLHHIPHSTWAHVGHPGSYICLYQAARFSRQSMVFPSRQPFPTISKAKIRAILIPGFLRRIVFPCGHGPVLTVHFSDFGLAARWGGPSTVADLRIYPQITCFHH
jgi:hypothetical protein